MAVFWGRGRGCGQFTQSNGRAIRADVARLSDNSSGRSVAAGRTAMINHAAISFAEEAYPLIQAHSHHAGGELVGGLTHLGAGSRTGDDRGCLVQMLHNRTVRWAVEEARSKTGLVQA